MIRPPIFVCVLLAGCTSREVTSFDLARAGADYVFFTMLDARGVPVRVGGMLGVGEDGFTFGGDAHVVLADHEAEVVAVGLTREVLTAAFPPFDVSREQELAVRLETPKGVPTVVPGRSLIIETSLPEGTVAFRASSTELRAAPEVVGALEAAVTLSIPIDHRVCKAENAPSLQRFGDRDDLLDPVPDHDHRLINFLRVIRVDEDRLLGMTALALYLLYRGQAVDLNPGRFFPANIDPLVPPITTGKTFEGIALDRTPDAGGKLRVTLVGHDATTPMQDFEGRYWDLSLGPEGLELISTTTVAPPLRAVAIDWSGTLAFAAYGGRVWTRRRGQTALERLPDLPIPVEREREVQRIAWTDDLLEPLVAASVGRLHVYSTSAAAWQSTEILISDLSSRILVSPNETDVRFRALASYWRGTENEMWAGGTSGALFRREGHGVWEQIVLLPPPDYSPCSRPHREYPDAVISDPIDDLVIGPNHMRFTIRECTAVVEVRRSDLCTSLIRIGDADPSPVAAQDLQALDLQGARLTVAGERGQVFEQR